MTDKQIIIDGIDVSKCKYIDIENFEKPICHCISQRNECEMPCEYNKDCYFKQLARKEQECKELTSQRDKFEFGNNILEHERNKYKQALDEVKEYCNRYSTNSIGFKQCILDIISKTEEQ